MGFRCLVSTIICTVLLVATSALAAPELVVDRSVFDFGKIPQGKRVDHVFRFRNKGDTPLSIIRTRTSCGCTVANVSPKTVPPGKEGDIKVTFDSGNFAGPIHKIVYVETNDPNKPTFNLVIQGTVQEELVITPRDLNIGSVKAGGRKEVAITLENRGSRTITITSAKSPAPQVTIKSAKTVIRPGEATKLFVTVTARQDDRFISGYVAINTDIPGKGEFLLPLYGSVVH